MRANAEEITIEVGTSLFVSTQDTTLIKLAILLTPFLLYIPVVVSFSGSSFYVYGF